MVKQYFILTNCLLIIISAYLGVSTAYEVAAGKLSVEQTVSGPQTQQTREPEAVRHPLAYYKGIAGRNLLNISSGEVKPEKEVDLESLEKTELKLKLWGTVTGDKKGAYAVIEDTKARSQNLYRKGDTVQGAEIKMILREKVVLNAGGEDEVLEMEKAEGGPSKVRTASRQPPRRPSGHGSSQTITLKRSQIDDALKNVNDLMQQVRIMPHFQNGEADGFSLTGIRPNSIVRKMGLRNGDVITGVNGSKIETMDDAMGFYQQLSSGETVSVDMKRRGRERTIEYKIK
jgi:general secretion pathway protein C